MSMFIINGCVSTSAQNGMGIGAVIGATGVTLYDYHKHHHFNRNHALIGGLIGAASGYFIGNEMDKSHNYGDPEKLRQYPLKKTIPFNPPGYRTNIPVTRCKKVVVRKWVNGKMIETIKETCEGEKTGYYY